MGCNAAKQRVAADRAPRAQISGSTRFVVVLTAKAIFPHPQGG